jgi:ABC-type multidrug transport system ATPase subunit
MDSNTGHTPASASFPLNTFAGSSSIGRGSFFARLEGEDIRWKPPKRENEILRGISTGPMDVGSVCAVMGGSGAGKTTLLKILGGSIRQSSGKVLVNGVDRSQLGKQWKHIAKFIPQEDVLPRSLTPRQVLSFQARLCGLSPEEADMAMTEVLDRLHLRSCADTQIGDGHTLQGLSGGERKRCSLALELLKRPKVLLLDECTSGLDSPLALELMTMLQSLCKANGTACSERILAVCTIHQPSSKVFALFDSLLLLRQGEVAYAGPRSQVEAYFAGLGDLYNLPPQTNPAEHFMDILQGPHPPPTMQLPSPQDAASIPQQPAGLALQLFEGPANAYAIPQWRQVWLLLRRTLLIRTSDPAQCRVRIVLSAAIACILGLTYFQVSSEQSTVTDRQAVIFGCLTFLTMNTLVTTAIQFPLEKAFIFREYSNGTYKLSAWYVSNMVGSLLMQLLYTFVYVTILYWMVGFRSSLHHYFTFLGVTLTMGSIGVVLGTALGIVLPAVHMVTAIVPPLIMPQLLFSGFMVRPDNIPIYFKPLYYISFFQYSFQILLVDQFHDFEFEQCTPGLDFCPLGPGQKSGDVWIEVMMGYSEHGSLTCWLALGLMIVVLLMCGYWAAKLKAARG